MKKGFMKKALAVVLSTAMTVSVSSAAQMQSVLAAKKYVGLNTTFKTLKVGQSNYKLKLVNNTVGWKIKKVVSTDKSIATAYGKTASYVKLKGKSEGRATIRVSVQTSKRKKNNQKTLRCRVKVVEASVTDPQQPDKPSTPDPVQTNVQVSTQADLEAALKNPSVTSITLDTTAAASFNIPSGQYANVDLTVNAPNADVVNNAKFKSVTVKAISSQTWTEKATGNSFRVEALKARFIVETGASMAGITITSANADIAIMVNGTLAGVTVNAKAKVAMTGASKTKVPVSIEAAAAGTELTTAVQAEVKTAVNANIVLEAGAEESTVQITSKTATVSVKNNTTKKITVTRPDNTKSEVAAKGSVTVNASTSTPSGSGSSGWYGGGSSGSTTDTSSKAVSTQDELNAALKDANIRTITIKDADGTLKIEKEDYSSRVKLIVDSPKATIENYAEFKSIEIRDISWNTWREHGKKNNFQVTAKNPHIVVEEDAVVKAISFIGSVVRTAKLEVKGQIEQSISCAASKEAQVTVDVAANAKIAAKVSISVEMEVLITGTNTAKIPVAITAENARFSSAVPVAVELAKKAFVWLEETAVDSSIEFATKDTTVVLDTAVDVATTVKGETTEGTISKDTPAGEVDASGEAVEDGTQMPDEKPAPEEPKPEEPGTDEPGTEEPGPDEPGTEEPGPDEPGTEEPGPEEPGAAAGTMAVTVISNSALTISTGALTVDGEEVAVTNYGQATLSSGNATADHVKNTGYTFANNVTFQKGDTVTFEVITAAGTYTVTVSIPEGANASGVSATGQATPKSATATS